jgi:hypothetical protein
MIFNVSDNFETIESYKERNLYYKIFAGYLFNELIPNEDERKNKFLSLLTGILDQPKRFKGDKNKISDLLTAFGKENIQATFDYHSAQIIKVHKKDDRGEMSDVLLLTKSHFNSIECKFLENMEIKKDVRSVQMRIEVVSEKLGLIPLQVLLMKEKKWRNSQKAGNKKDSFYTLFQNEKVTIPTIVLFWEELVSLIDEDANAGSVKKYLLKQVERKKIKD